MEWKKRNQRRKKHMYWQPKYTLTQSHITTTNTGRILCANSNRNNRLLHLCSSVAIVLLLTRNEKNEISYIKEKRDFIDKCGRKTSILIFMWN